MKHVVYQDFLSEIFQHYSRDIGRLASRGFVRSGRTKIRAIQKMGDTHEKGRSVVRVTLDKNYPNNKIMYKPRCLKVEKAFGKFIIWINSKTGLNLKSPVCVLGEEYGWSEYIRFKACQTKKEVNNFYLKLGALTAICVFLRGTDVHHENIIAHGDTPYIVDYETFLTPHLSDTDSPHWVIFTAILPRWRKTSESKRLVDKSAFSGFYGNAKKANNHIPKLKNKRVNPYDYSRFFLKGFKKAFLLFKQYRKFLVSSKHSPLRVFKNVVTRIVLKDTAYYLQCLKTNCFDTLSDYEIAMLKNNDIPLFRVRANKSRVFNRTYENIPIGVTQPGYLSMLDEIKKYANSENYALQKNIVKQSLLAGFLNYKFTGRLVLGEKINIKNRVTVLQCINSVNKNLRSDHWVLAKA